MYLRLLFLLLILNAFTVLAQSTPDGTWDTSFDIGLGADETVKVIKELPDGKLIIAGLFTQYDGQNVNQIARLNHDGSLDTTFSAPFISDQLTDVLIDGDKILVTGYQVGPARLNADGSLDTSFSTDLEYSKKIAKQGDKYIITGASAVAGTGVYYGGLLRLNNDGSLDETFSGTGIGTGTGNNGGGSAINKTIVLSDNKLLVLGWFGFYNGAPANSVVRLNQDGTIDSTFIVPTGKIWGSVNNAVELPGGGYIITGSFVYVVGTEQRVFTAKIDNSGNFVAGFQVPWLYSILGTSIALQNNGNVIIGGWANGNNNYYRMVRLLPDGSTDTDFNLSGEFSPNGIECISLQDDYKILVAGRFTMFDNINRNRVARLNNDDKLSNDSFLNAGISVYPNPTNGEVFMRGGHQLPENSSVRVFNVEGRLLYEGSASANNALTNLSGFDSGVYIIEISGGNKTSIHKIIKS